MKDVCLSRQQMALQKVSCSYALPILFCSQKYCLASFILCNISTLTGGTDFSVTNTSCCFATNQSETECKSIQLLEGAREGRTFSVRLVAGSRDCVCNETLEIMIGCPCKL